MGSILFLMLVLFSTLVAAGYEYVNDYTYNEVAVITDIEKQQIYGAGVIITEWYVLSSCQLLMKQRWNLTSINDMLVIGASFHGLNQTRTFSEVYYRLPSYFNNWHGIGILLIKVNRVFHKNDVLNFAALPRYKAEPWYWEDTAFDWNDCYFIFYDKPNSNSKIKNSKVKIIASKYCNANVENWISRYDTICVQFRNIGPICKHHGGAGLFCQNPKYFNNARLAIGILTYDGNKCRNLTGGRMGILRASRYTDLINQYVIPRESSRISTISSEKLLTIFLSLFLVLFIY